MSRRALNFPLFVFVFLWSNGRVYLSANVNNDAREVKMSKALIEIKEASMHGEPGSASLRYNYRWQVGVRGRNGRHD
jgi:hypothetical protein